jgi:ribosomal protein L2
LSLIFFSNGAISYYLATEFHRLTMFICSRKFKKIKKVKFFPLALRFFQIKKLTFLSCLEISPGYGAQYSRSAGAKSRLFKFEKDNHTVLVELPSGLKKTFSYYSFALLGQLAMPLHYKRVNGKAGF